MSCDLIAHKFHVEKVSECPPSTVPEDLQRLLEFMQDGDCIVLADQNLVDVALNSSEKPLLIVQTEEPSVARLLDSIIRQILSDGRSYAAVAIMEASPAALCGTIDQNIEVTMEKVEFFLSAAVRHPIVGTCDPTMYGSVILSKKAIIA